MTYLFNNPTTFVEELIEGFAAAYRLQVQSVNGGVMRRHKPKHRQVVVVIGGGSGHYPAFGGFVGAGLAHGAALGNVFASPSAQQICQVAQAVNAGGGILFGYGNYAGDVLNFTQAQERLHALGIDVRSVVVTDDIASAITAERHLRRGITGMLPVFKAAAVAADAGKSLEEVFRIATEANDRVRTLGVAFSGCTLPGADKPLFEVTAGTMEVGMGIHGEPGLYRIEAPSADGLAQILTEKLLCEIPSGVKYPEGARIGVILNSLGAVTQEELFVLYRKIDQLLSARGLIIVEPLVGELITSFDMAGVSLTLFWLNDEMEETWLAAADTPALRRNQTLIDVQLSEDIKSHGSSTASIQPLVRQAPAIGSAESQAAARLVLTMLEAAQIVIDEHREALGRLDAVAGDGDHGIGMQRGMAAAVKAARVARDAQAGVESLLTAAGNAWADQAGGTSGALWGVILRSLGSALGNYATPSASSLAAGIASALHNVVNLGKAQPGDKTLVDVLHPFSGALDAAISRGLSIAAAWTVATDIADEAGQATQHLLQKIGRARPHAGKSLGIPDPGAISLVLILRSVERILIANCS